MHYISNTCRYPNLQEIRTSQDGSTSRDHGHVQQLSQKWRLDGKEQSAQAFEKAEPLISILPEETSSRGSGLLLVFSRCDPLTVGFGFAAAANPIRKYIYVYMWTIVCV